MAENTTILTVRLSNEINDWYRSVSTRKVLESLYGLVKSERLYCSGDELVVSQLYRVRTPINVDYKEKYEAMERRYVIERDTRREIDKRLTAIEGDWHYALGGVSIETLKALEEAAVRGGTTIGGLVTDLCQKILSGHIEVDGGIVVKEKTIGAIECKPFMDACDKMNKSYDYTMDKVVKMIYGGEI